MVFWTFKSQGLQVLYRMYTITNLYWCKVALKADTAANGIIHHWQTKRILRNKRIYSSLKVKGTMKMFLLCKCFLWENASVSSVFILAFFPLSVLREINMKKTQLIMWKTVIAFMVNQQNLSNKNCPYYRFLFIWETRLLSLLLQFRAKYLKKY